MTKKITLALIGRGHWGSTYRKTIDGMTDIVLPDKFIFGRDYKEQLNKIKISEIDGVIIAATTSAHFEIASYLLNRGFCNLLIEKPLTQTLNQAKQLESIVKTIPNAKILVGHLMLYDPAWKRMKKASKNLGKILKISYTALKGPPVKEGNILQDAGPHPIYLFMDILRKPKIVTAKKKKYDNIELIFEFSNGARGSATIGAIYPYRIRGIEIEGDKGKLILNEFVNPRKLQYFYGNASNELYFPTQTSSLEQEIKEFANCIQGKKPGVSISDGLEVVRIIDLAEKSLSLVDS